MAKRGGLRTGPLGEREYVQIGEWQAFDERQRCGVVFVGFAGKSGDDIGANGGVRQNFAD